VVTRAPDYAAYQGTAPYAVKSCVLVFCQPLFSDTTDLTLQKRLDSVGVHRARARTATPMRTTFGAQFLMITVGQNICGSAAR